MATALASISLWLLDKMAGKGFEKLTDKLKTKELDQKFKFAIKNASKQLQQKYPDILGSDIEFFFLEKDVFFELFKLLFRISKPNIEIVQNKFDVSTLPPKFISEFVDLLKQELLSDRDFDEILSNNEIYFAISGIHENIETVKNNTTLSTSEIQTIRKILQEKFETNFNKVEFQRIYSASVLTVLSQVNFIGLGLKSHIRKNRKKLQDIYVKPRFGIVDPKFRKTLDNNLFVKNTRRDYHDDVEETLSFDKLFSLEKNFVILGNPGSGKSFLVKKIICSLLEKSLNDFENKAIFDFTSFRVELRKYHQFKKDKNSGIVRYILSSLESEYGIVNTPEKPFINLLKEEDVLIFFDGLDEIFNASDKVEIKSDIENFIANHKKVKAIVTSRIIGYDEAKLNDINFSVRPGILPHSQYNIVE